MNAGWDQVGPIAAIALMAGAAAAIAALGFARDRFAALLFAAAAGAACGGAFATLSAPDLATAWIAFGAGAAPMLFWMAAPAAAMAAPPVRLIQWSNAALCAAAGIALCVMIAWTPAVPRPLAPMRVDGAALAPLGALALCALIGVSALLDDGERAP